MKYAAALILMLIGKYESLFRLGEFKFKSLLDNHEKMRGRALGEPDRSFDAVSLIFRS
jgi:hypothetical protein